MSSLGTEESLRLCPEELLYSALSLLNFEFVEESKLIGVQIGGGTFDDPCPKAFYSILKFLLLKFTTETIDMMIFYPPRHTKDVIAFKQEAYKLLLNLQKRAILPKCLFLSK